MAYENLWQQLLSAIQGRISRQNFEVWFSQIKMLEVQGQTLHLEVPGSYYRDWIHDNYQELILGELERLTDTRFQLQFHAPGEFRLHSEGGTRAASARGVADRSLLDSSGPVTAPAVSGGAYGSASVASSTFSLNPDQTFETFVVGSSNQFAHAGAMAVAEKPARTYNPLFLFGMVGLGKTHLLNAIGNRILRDNPSARIVYLSSEQFVNELINSIRDERMNEFRNKYRDNCDALLVDDIQFLAGKIRTQEEFFYTFNALHTSGKQIVVTSDKFPREIQGMEERLRNRFEWGLIADIQPPDLETKAAILKKKAAREHTILPDDVAMFIATHTNSNIRELEGILIRLNAAASVYQKPIDLQFTQFALRDVLKSAKPALTIDGILETVSKFYDTRVNDMKSQKKHKQLVWPRQVAMYLCRRHTSGSFPEIGQKFGGRDHTTVIHAVKKIEESLSRDPEVSTQIKELERLLGF